MNENGTPDPGAAGAQPPQPAPQPQQPPQAAQYAPPPQQPYTAAPQTGQPAQPKKSKRSIVIIAIVAVILVLLTCCCITAGYFVYQDAASTQATQEQIDEIIVHAENASTSMAELDALWVDWDANDSADAPPPTEASFKYIADINAEIAEATTATEALRDSVFKTEMLSALSELEEVVILYDEFLTALDETWATMSAVTTLSDQFAEANEKLGDAVTLMNKEDYADGKKAAQEAKTTYDKVAAGYRSLHAENLELELDKLAAMAEKSSVQAGHVVKQGDLGPKSSVTAYNKEVDAYNDLTG